MRRVQFGGWVLVAAVALVAGCGPKGPPPLHLVLNEDDPEMKAAIEKARETLPKFWALYASPGPLDNSFALEIKWTDPDGNSKYVWAGEIEKKGTEITGKVATDVMTMEYIENGPRVTIRPEEILDWLYVHEDRIMGSHTTRVLTKQMPPELAQKYQWQMREEENPAPPAAP